MSLIGRNVTLLAQVRPW